MRRMIGSALLVGLALSNVGCLAVISSKGPFKCGASDKQAVVIDGEIYLVDLRGYGVQKIDAEAVAEAETITRTEVITTETETTGD